MGQTLALNPTDTEQHRNRRTSPRSAAASTLLPENILDTPQSINVVPAEVIQQQGVTNLQDALKNVPGITLNAGEGGTHGDLSTCAASPPATTISWTACATPDSTTATRSITKSLEVYKGPASTLFGRGSTGGVINQVLKSAAALSDRRLLRHRRHQ